MMRILLNDWPFITVTSRGAVKECAWIAYAVTSWQILIVVKQVCVPCGYTCFTCKVYEPNDEGHVTWEKYEKIYCSRTSVDHMDMDWCTFCQKNLLLLSHCLNLQTQQRQLQLRQCLFHSLWRSNRCSTTRMQMTKIVKILLLQQHLTLLAPLHSFCRSRKPKIHLLWAIRAPACWLGVWLLPCAQLLLPCSWLFFFRSRFEMPHKMARPMRWPHYYAGRSLYHAQYFRGIYTKCRRFQTIAPRINEDLRLR